MYSELEEHQKTLKFPKLSKKDKRSQRRHQLRNRVVEDDVIRNRRHKKKFEDLAETFAKRGNSELAELMKFYSTLTAKGYNNQRRLEREQAEQEKKDFFKANPMREEVVIKILDWFENTCEAADLFKDVSKMEIFGITEDEQYYGLYDALIHGQKIKAQEKLLGSDFVQVV